MVSDEWLDKDDGKTHSVPSCIIANGQGWGVNSTPIIRYVCWRWLKRWHLDCTWVPSDHLGPCLFIELALHEFRHLLHMWWNKIWYFKPYQATLERISTRATGVTISLVETGLGCSTAVVGPNLPVHRQLYHQHPSSELEKLLIIPMILLFVKLRTFV